MDPAANLAEQIEIAREVIAGGEREGSPDAQETVELSRRLAELVLALDEWRRKGGFDPYAS